MMKGRPVNPKLEELPDWARSAFETSIDTAKKITPSTPDRGDVAWPLLLDAAVVSSFLPRELAPNDPSAFPRSEAERKVVEFSETLRQPGGLKWCLTDNTRRAVLQQALETGEIKEAIGRTAEHFSDPVSRAMRTLLTDAPSQAPGQTLDQLEAERIALSYLSGLPGISLPRIDEVDREIELRRLLAVFERMIGRRPSESAEEPSDRFFGRERELQRLREYVGVLPPQSLYSRISDTWQKIAGSLLGRAPLVVWGVGGVGKTTLISRFMLEHARAAESHYPFAYLDFDRSTISARDRVGLFMEICRQIAVQFPELHEKLSDLRSRVIRFGAGTAEATDRDSISRLLPYIREFRSLIDSYMSSLESRFEWARPFLLVLDTFEVVQYVFEDAAGLEEFIGAFSLPSETKLWPRMRLVVAGRKQVKEFLGERVESLSLGALDAEGSRDMIMALAADAGKSITPKEAQELVSAIAKVTEKRKNGVQPLRLRLIGELFAKSQVDGKSFIASLMDELSKPAPSGPISEVLIDDVLVRRILNHVSDPRVRALADPGLVVRRITPEIIREVMTRGTRKPSQGESPDNGDSTVTEPWEVDEREAQDIFDAFRREVSLVQIEGDALRHRADVRQQMILLIRARRPNRFLYLHQLAFKYYSSRLERNPSDLATAAEAIYHALWLKVEISLIDRWWSNDPNFDPKIDPDEFAESSVERGYLRAKSGNTMDLKQVRLLPKEVAQDWVAARGQVLLGRQRINDDEVDVFRQVLSYSDDAKQLDPETEATAIFARLLYRSGLWHEALQLLTTKLESFGRLDLFDENCLSCARTFMTLAAKGTYDFQPPDLIAETCVAAARQLRDPLLRVEVLSHEFVRRFKKDRIIGPLVNEVLPRDVVVSPAIWLRNRWILRLAVLSGIGDRRSLLALYLTSIERQPREQQLFVDERLNRWLNYIDYERDVRSGSRSSEAQGNSEAMDSAWSKQKNKLARGIRESEIPIGDVWGLFVCDHADWIRCLGHAFVRAWRSRDTRSWLSELLDSGFLVREKLISAGRLNGIEVIREISDNGRLLEFAKALSEWSPEKSSYWKSLVSDPTPDPTPDLVRLAVSLLSWHDTLLALDPDTHSDPLVAAMA